MTKLIQQEDDYGCAVAGLAMALGMTYAEAKAEVRGYWECFRCFEKYEGLNHKDEKIILFKHDIQTFDFRPIKPGKATKKYVGTLQALITVPSINVPGLYHSVFWDGKKLHDPSKKKRHTAAMVWKRASLIRILVPVKREHLLYGIKGPNKKDKGEYT